MRTEGRGGARGPISVKREESNKREGDKKDPTCKDDNVPDEGQDPVVGGGEGIDGKATSRIAEYQMMSGKDYGEGFAPKARCMWSDGDRAAAGGRGGTRRRRPTRGTPRRRPATALRGGKTEYCKLLAGILTPGNQPERVRTPAQP